MRIFVHLWQLPQILLSLVLILAYRAKRLYDLESPKAYVFSSDTFPSGISLGPVIIVRSLLVDHANTIKHEHGHSKQSLMLGPLYLVVVGVPSILLNILGSFLYKLGYPKFSLNYYRRWPESWADRLGKVSRS